MVFQIASLTDKYSASGIKSNGLRSQLRLTLLINVIQERAHHPSVVGDRDAQLEELPHNDDRDIHLVNEAEEASVIIQMALSEKLLSVDISTHVIVCNQYKPLMQVFF